MVRYRTVGRAGSGGTEDALHVFDEMLRRGRGASIYRLNCGHTVVARNSPAAALTCYKPTTGWSEPAPTRLEAVTFNPLLRGLWLCAEKRTRDAMDERGHPSPCVLGPIRILTACQMSSPTTLFSRGSVLRIAPSLTASSKKGIWTKLTVHTMKCLTGRFCPML
uniref:Uncharacterized protein n=1 Tax=Leersia perrieri TaxID=77586 RepID=A0A0D9XKX5_9ORYZ